MADGANPPDGRQVLSAAVRAVFSRWTLLRLAVDQGWSDGDGKALAHELLETVLALLLRDKKVYQDEVEDLLFNTLEEKFNALAEDGSVEDISTLLLTLRSECAAGNFTCEGRRTALSPRHLVRQMSTANVSALSVGQTDLSDSDDGDCDGVEAMAIEPTSHHSKKEPVFDEDGFQCRDRTAVAERPRLDVETAGSRLTAHLDGTLGALSRQEQVDRHMQRVVFGVESRRACLPAPDDIPFFQPP